MAAPDQPIVQSYNGELLTPILPGGGGARFLGAIAPNQVVVVPYDGDIQLFTISAEGYTLTATDSTWVQIAASNSMGGTVAFYSGVEV